MPTTYLWASRSWPQLTGQGECPSSFLHQWGGLARGPDHQRCPLLDKPLSWGLYQVTWTEVKGQAEVDWGSQWGGSGGGLSQRKKQWLCTAVGTMQSWAAGVYLGSCEQTTGSLAVRLYRCALISALPRAPGKQALSTYKWNITWKTQPTHFLESFL